MASSDSSGAQKPGRRNRPGPPTIDLKATELAREGGGAEATEAEGAPAPEQSPKAPRATAAEGVSPEQPPEAPRAAAAEGAPPPEQPPEAPQAAEAGPEPEADGPARGLWWRAPVMAAAALALTVLVIATLWTTGALSPKKDSAPSLAQRLSALETRADELARRPVPAAADPRPMNELSARVTAAEQALRGLNGVPARLATAEQATQPLAELGRRVDSLGARLDKLESAGSAPASEAPTGAPPAEGAGQSDAAVNALGARVAALEAAVKTLTEGLSASGSAQQAASDRSGASDAALKSLVGRVVDLGQRIDQAAAQARAAEGQAAAAKEAAQRESGTERATRLALVTAALRDAAASGKPYPAELTALKALAPDAAPLGSLEPFAASGVPSAAVLGRELLALVPAMEALVPPPKRHGGFLGRLQARAERLVRVRPINEVAGDDQAAIISRIEGAARRRDIDAAVAELGQLPPDVRAPADAWIKTAQARRAALDGAGRLASDAAAALGKD